MEERDFFDEAITFLAEAEEALTGVATDLKNRIAYFLKEVSAGAEEFAEKITAPDEPS